AQEGVTRISWMEMAWEYAQGQSRIKTRPTLGDILMLARYVEPGRNQRGFRETPVFIYEGWRPTIDWRSVPESVQALMEHGEELTPLEFYVEFEVIHPFADGNGRVGAILYNWLRGTLDRPETPADVFSREHEPFDEADEAGLEEGLHQAINYPIQGADEPCYEYEEDDEAAEFEAQLDAEDEERGGCCQPWWEPCCTRDGAPL
ncbi:hypothetical protein LCGC14_3030760, partial [marine sediment metagenome]